MQKIGGLSDKSHFQDFFGGGGVVDVQVVDEPWQRHGQDVVPLPQTAHLHVVHCLPHLKGPVLMKLSQGKQITLGLQKFLMSLIFIYSSSKIILKKLF